MNGELIFNGGNCYYTFDEKNMILEVFCLNGEAENLLWEKVKSAEGVSYLSAKKAIPTNRIEGSIFENDGKTVVFYIYATGYGHSGALFSDRAVLRINVSKYLVISHKQSTINYLAFGSKQFHKFLNLIPRYYINRKREDKLAEITYASDSEKMKAEFEYNNENFIAYPYASYSGGVKFDFTPRLTVESNHILNEEECIYLCDRFIELFEFLFMRRNIIPDYIFYQSRDKRFDIFYNKGTKYKEEKEKVDNFLSNGFISWGAIFQVFSNVINDAFSNSIYLKCLGDDSKSRTWINFEKVSSYSAFFESTYALIYGKNVKHKTSSQKEIDLIIETLNSIRNDSKKSLNKKLDYLIFQLDHVALNTKIQRVFNDYRKCLSLVKSDFYLSNYTDEEIAGICANTRNWTDHGDEQAIITSHIASCFAYMNCSSYAMYLRRWGLDDETIAHQLHILYLVQ